MKLVWNVALTAASDGRLDDPEPLWDAVRRYAHTVTRDDVEVEVRFLPCVAEAMKYPMISLLNGAIMIEDIRRSVAEGADGVMIAPVGEPALDEARSAVDVPLVGSLEAGMALTQFLGRRVEVITISEAYVTIVTRNLRRYGLTGRLMDHRPIRHIAMDWRAVAAALEGDAGPLLESFTTVADAMVADGADVIVAGGQIFGSLLLHAGWTPGPVPIVDIASAGLKALESLVDLRASVGLATSAAPSSPFRRVPDAEIEAGFATLRAMS